MSTHGSPSVQGSEDGRAQALQALLNTLSPGNVHSDGFGQHQNEKGELVNDEGLPIVDIVEPVSESLPATSSESIHVFDDPDRLPLWVLSPAEKARRRTEREHLLDILEEEERLQRERDDQAERERWQEEVEKRKQAAKAEMDEVRRARELQKKMGKALLRNVLREKEEKEREKQFQENQQQAKKEETRSLKLKKSVTFADVPEDKDEVDTVSPSLGDMSLARLQKPGNGTLVFASQMDRQPMKMNVVERPSRNVGSRPFQINPPEFQDSDDESVPADSDEGDPIHSDDSDEHLQDESLRPLSDSDSTGDAADDSEPVVWQAEDFDFAQHQREVALAYYEKRSTIGAETSRAMRAHTHDQEENDWDQPEVPLEATLASPPPKPSVSKFKTERLLSSKSSSSLPSHSLGPSVLPSSQSSSLKRAVRLGRLEDDQLVGEAEDSGDDEEREAKEIWEMLIRGELTNAGPPSHQVSSVATDTTPGLQSSSTSEQQVLQSDAGSSPALKSQAPKISKFKLTLAQTRDQAGRSSSGHSTPIAVVERSSPKLTTPNTGTPIAIPSSAGRHPSPIQTKSAPIADARPLSPLSSSIMAGSPSFQSIVLPSPSYPHLHPPSSSFPLHTPTQSIRQSASPTVPDGGMITDCPPTIMAAEVRETSRTQGGDTASRKERKVSRFLAERA